jgi:hypothetical protein
MRLYHLFFLLGFPGLVSAQSDYAASSIPPVCLAGANSVIRVAQTDFHVTGPDEVEVEDLFAVTILNGKGNEMNTWKEQEDQFTKVKRIQGALYDAQGKLVRESEKKEVREQGSFNEYEFSNAHLKYLEMEYNQFPYTVVFKAKKVIKGFFRIDDFIVRRLGQSVVKSTFVFTNPADFQYDWKGINTDVKPAVTKSGKETVSTWTFENLPALPTEPFNPYFNDAYARLVFIPHHIKIDNYVGDFSNWQSISKFMYNLNNGRDAVSPVLQQKIQDITRGKSTREKIAILYKYLQDNNRYVSIQIGIGGWQTIEAGVVEQKKYGDCKALSNYMKAMLKVAGIEARLVAIFGGDKKVPEVSDDLPIPYFNHMILYVPSEHTWLECTSHASPTGYLGYFTAGRPGLCMAPEGGGLLMTPALTAQDNTEVNQTDIRLDDAGNAVIENRLTATGDLHDTYREQALREKQPDIEKRFIDKAGFSIAKLNKLQITPQVDKPEASVKYEAEARNFTSRSGKRIFVPLHKTNLFNRSLPPNDKRVLDLKLRHAYIQTDTVVFHLPAGYSMENLPANKKITSEFGEYELAVQQAPGQVTAVIRLLIQPVSVPAARYNEVRQFYIDVAKVDGSQMVLVKQE